MHAPSPIPSACVPPLRLRSRRRSPTRPKKEKLSRPPAHSPTVRHLLSSLPLPPRHFFCRRFASLHRIDFLHVFAFALWFPASHGLRDSGDADTLKKRKDKNKRSPPPAISVGHRLASRRICRITDPSHRTESRVASLLPPPPSGLWPQTPSGPDTHRILSGIAAHSPCRDNSPSTTDSTTEAASAASAAILRLATIPRDLKEEDDAQPEGPQTVSRHG
jgi:hypothetical protein